MPDRHASPGQTTLPRVLVVGAANVDIAGRPAVALCAMDSAVGSVTLSAGGVGRNIAENLSKLGAQTTLLTAWGDDAWGAFLQRQAQQVGLDVSPSIVVPQCATGAYLAMLDAAGEMRMAVNDMKVLDHLTPQALQQSAVAQASWVAVVLDCNLPQTTLIWALHQWADTPVFVEAVSAQKVLKLQGHLPQVQRLKLNRQEAQALCQTRIDSLSDARSAVQTLLNAGVGAVLLSLAQDGVLLGDRSRGMLWHQESPKVTLENATGAGDAMMAGWVWGVLRGQAAPQILATASACAALCLQSSQTVANDMSPPALARMQQCLGEVTSFGEHCVDESEI